MENVDVYSAIPVKRGDVMISDVISHAQLLNKTMSNKTLINEIDYLMLIYRILWVNLCVW